MSPRLSTGPRLCGILLLVLMVSPLTAPFSTCDLYDLLDEPRPGGAAVLQSKPVSDDPAAAVSTPGGLRSPQLAVAATATPLTAQPGWRAVLYPQLRI